VSHSSTKSSSFGGDLFTVVLSSVVSQTAAVGATLALVRILPVAEFGQIALLLSVTSLAGTAGQLGMKQVLIRSWVRLPSEEEQRLACGSVLGIRAVSAVGAACMASAYLYHVSAPLLIVAIAWPLGFVLAVTDLYDAYWFAASRLGVMRRGSVVSSCTALAMLPIAWFARTLEVAALVYLFQHVARLSVYLSEMGRTAAGNDWRKSLTTFVESAPLYWQALLTAGTQQLPVIFLVGAGSSEVAYFSATQKIIMPFTLLVASTTAVMLPHLSRSPIHRVESSVVEDFVTSGVFVLSASALVLSLAPTQITVALFGQAFMPSSAVLQRMAWIVPLSFLFNVMGTILLVRQRDWVLTMLSTVFTLVVVVSAAAWAPAGAKSLAFALLAAHSVNLAYHWLVFRKVNPNWTLKRPIGVLVALGAASVAVTYVSSVPLRVLCGLLILTSAGVFLWPTLARAQALLVASSRRQVPQVAGV
jgi:O-antigen/teichoic acid export membrane protein